MIIGMPKEIKDNEYRVAMTPAASRELVSKGHRVYVEYGAGERAGFPDDEYAAAGAILAEAAEIYEQAELIYKVKEVLPQEYDRYREGQILFTYIHSETRPEMTAALVKSGIVGISYEDVTDDDGSYPLLQPMSEVAGRGGFMNAFKYMQTTNYGTGKMLSRICGLETPHIVIIGCGIAGCGAAEYAAALGNRVSMLDINKSSMDKARRSLPVNVEILHSNRANLLKCLREADAVINCVAWDHRCSEHIIYKEDLKLMKKTAVIIDVTADDHGAVESSHMTTHSDPTYYEDGILHYCVPNIPSLYAHTASVMLASATLPYVMEIAEKGLEKALLDNRHLRRALTFWHGRVTWKETADMCGYPYISPEDALAGR